MSKHASKVARIHTANANNSSLDKSAAPTASSGLTGIANWMPYLILSSANVDGLKRRHSAPMQTGPWWHYRVVNRSAGHVTVHMKHIHRRARAAVLSSKTCVTLGFTATLKNCADEATPTLR